MGALKKIARAAGIAVFAWGGAAFAAPCPNCVSVGVAEIESEVDCEYFAGQWGRIADCGTNARAFQTMLETAIISTGKFQVYERGQISTILKEHALGRAGVTNRGDQIGNTEAAGYLVYGTITELGYNTDTLRTSDLAVQTVRVSMAVDVKITDVDTGQIRYAGTVREVFDMDNGFAADGMSTSSSSSLRASFGSVQRNTAKAVAGILVTQAYPIKVLNRTGSTVYLNYGQSLLSVGDQVEVVEAGEELVDPDTGAALGFTEEPVALFRVVEVNDKFSKAQLVSGDAGDVASGQVARIKSRVGAGAAARRPKKELP